MRILINVGLFIFFLLAVCAVLAFWKGGDPFRWLGENIIVLGKAIISIGDGVDEFLHRS